MVAFEFDRDPAQALDRIDFLPRDFAGEQRVAHERLDAAGHRASEVAEEFVRFARDDERIDREVGEAAKDGDAVLARKLAGQRANNRQTSAPL